MHDTPITQSALHIHTSASLSAIHMHQFDRVLHIYVCYTCPQAGIFAVPGVDLHTQIPHSGPEKGFIRRHVMKHPKDGRKKVVAWAGAPMIATSAILSPGN